MSDEINFLKECIGCKVIEINGLVYFYNDERGDIQELQIIFEGEKRVTLKCVLGEKILVSDIELKAIDMENFGKLVIENLFDDKKFCKFLNSTLMGCGFIYSQWAQRNIGVAFSFSNGELLNVLVLGDELFFYEKVPNDIQKEEELVIIEI